MIVPELRERRTVDRLLTGFFRDYRMASFQRAIGALTRFYALPRPQVEWYEYLDWGKTAGRTYENGDIHLVHPENWKRGRKYNSERQWIHTVYHELGHYVLWSDAERKADGFAYRFVRGVAAQRRTGDRAVLAAAATSRARRKRAQRPSQSRRRRNARGRRAVTTTRARA
jgi:predicted SprT family Zn-dependent metalloprotease